MKENSPLYLTIYFSITSLAVLSLIPRTFDRRCCRDVNSTSWLYISPRMHPRSCQDANAIPIGRPATTRATLDVNAAARLARSKSILSLVKRQKERERGREMERGSRDRDLGGFYYPTGRERAAQSGTGRELPGEIASLVPASPRASLRRKLPGRPFPRVYHVVKGTSCRSSRQGGAEREREREREREGASRRGFISRQYRERGRERAVALRAEAKRRDSGAAECNSYRDDDNVQSRRACDHRDRELIYELSP